MANQSINQSSAIVLILTGKISWPDGFYTIKWNFERGKTGDPLHGHIDNYKWIVKY